METGTRPGFQQRLDEYRPSKTVWFWSCIACVILTIVVGFSWGGWVTGGTAQAMVDDAAEQARYALAANVCVDKFMTTGDASAQLASLKQIDSSYRQGEFVEKGGWATMPGNDEPEGEVADLCAEQLIDMDLPPVQEAAQTEDGAIVAQ
ncbi:MAG: hypothetical protein ACREH6_03430 [Geminicoccaceae bacterium]